MKFTPKTEREIAEEGLLPEGEYDFEVIAAEEAISKAGNEMIVLRLRVFDQDGDQRTIRDWLMSDNHRKLRGACETMGLLDRYDAGSLDAADFIGRVGRVKLVIRKDKTGQYPDQNGVAFYVRPGDEKRQPARGREMVNDDIPF